MALGLGGSALIRLLYIVSHPIQYQAPLLRRIAAEPGIALRVLFERAGGRSFDPGFGIEVSWDQPLVEGYDHALVSAVDASSEIARADVVWIHGWESRLLRQLLRLAHAAARPVLMRGENADHAMPDGWGPRRWLKRIYLNRIFSRCAAFLAIGRANREYYLRRGVQNDRVFLMPYAVDNQFFASRAAAAAQQREKFRSALGLPQTPVILFVGKLQPRKRPDLLIQAWRRAFPAGSKPSLVFAGDGEMRPFIERQKDVTLLGFRNQGELPALYDLADVVVLPADKEPWGLVINEAMACGRAVIASDQCGAALDLIDDSTGAIFPAGDEEALAACLRAVLRNSAQRGDNARRRIAAWDFSADVRGLRQALAAAHGAA